MANFKVETEALIKSLVKDGLISSSAIDEIHLVRGYDYITDENEERPHYDQIGGLKIPWKKVQDALKLDSLEYDNGFGVAVFEGWITFKDKNAWIVRREYDGSEWWETVTRPKLGKN